MTINWGKSKHAILIGILFVAGLWKAVLVLANAFPFNSDEAVVSLMARHILAGERPIFFYGQSYMGSLDAYLVAAGFAIFGIHVWVVRLVQGIIYLAWLATTTWVGWSAFRDERIGLIAAGLLAIPTVNVQLYTTVTLGGYGEALLIGNLIILAAFRIANLLTSVQFTDVITNKLSFRKSVSAWFIVYCFLSGLGIWVLPLTLLFTIPAGIFIFLTFRKFWRLINFGQIGILIGSALFAFLVGLLPWAIYAYQNGLLRVFGEITGSAISVEQSGYFARTINHLIYYILLGIPVILGLRPPWAVRWLGLLVIPLILAIWGLIFITCIKRVKQSKTRLGLYSVLAGVILLDGIAFIFTSFGIDPSGRYFLPISAPLALISAGAIMSMKVPAPIVKPLMVGLLIIYNFIGTLQCASKIPPGITTQFDPVTIIDHRYDGELINFLTEQGETKGYSTYWVAYPLAFLSQERLVFIPRLPYHEDLRYTPRDDRYNPYDKLVAEANHVAYITTRHPLLSDRLRSSFKSQGITWEEQTIGDYLVFYHLSTPIRPELVDLTEVQP